MGLGLQGQVLGRGSAWGGMRGGVAGMGSTSEIALQGWREKGGVPNAGGLGFLAGNSAQKAVGMTFQHHSWAGDAEWTGTGESDVEEPGWGVTATVGVGVPFSFTLGSRGAWCQ